MTPKEYRKGYFRLIKGLFNTAALARWQFNADDYFPLISALQEIVSGNRWRLSISEKDAQRVTYCDLNRKYSQRFVTTFGRFVSRRLRTEVSSDAVNYLWDAYIGDFDAVYEIVEGKRLYWAYEDGYGSDSCMTGSSAYKVRVYVENPDKVTLLKYRDGRGHTARALLWHTDQGAVVLDRIYASTQLVIAPIETWAHSNGFLTREDLRRENPLTVTVKRPSNKMMPYIDTFCELLSYTEDTYTLTFWAESPLHIFNDTRGTDYATMYCCRCGMPLDEDSGDYYYENDEFYCDQCFHELYFWCEDCENYVSYNDSVTVHSTNGDEVIVCSYCAERYYIACQDCGDLYPEGYLEAVNTGAYGEFREVCTKCLDNYYHCEGCDEYFIKELMRGEYCVDCAEDENEDEGETLAA
jgi:hypothetical protein